jgi:hypothetical protein
MVSDEHFSQLTDAALAARRRNIVIGLAGALQSAKSMETATLNELAEADTADATPTAADKVLMAYQARSLDGG